MLKTLRHIFSSVWRGPFAVDLTPPISIGAAILRILEVCWKAAVIVSALTIVSIIPIAISEAANKILNPPMEKEISISIAYDTTRCTAEHPLQVSVTNNASDTLASVEFKIEAFKPGHSRDLNTYDSPKDWDAIVKPSETKHGCYRLPDRIDEPEKLTYVARVWRAERAASTP